MGFHPYSIVIQIVCFSFSAGVPAAVPLRLWLTQERPPPRGLFRIDFLLPIPYNRIVQHGPFSLWIHPPSLEDGRDILCPAGPGNPGGPAAPVCEEEIP